MDGIAYLGMVGTCVVALLACAAAWRIRRPLFIAVAVLLVAFAAQCVVGTQRYARLMERITYPAVTRSGDLVGTWRTDDGRELTLLEGGGCARPGTTCPGWRLLSSAPGSLLLGADAWQMFLLDGQLRLLESADLSTGDPDHWHYHRAYSKQQPGDERLRRPAVP